MAWDPKPLCHCPGTSSLLEAAWFLFLPFYAVINLFARLYRPTTKERRNESPDKRLAAQIIGGLPLAISLIVTAPLAVLAFLLWWPLQFCRGNFRYSSRQAPPPKLRLPSTLSVAQANVCLLPEYAARANNLNAPGDRVEAIADGLLNRRVRETSGSEDSELIQVETQLLVEDKAPIILYSNLIVPAFGHNDHIVETFPEHLDLLCLCEVFDREAAKCLVNALHDRFPYILWDVSQRPAINPARACNSGLLLASRFPFLDAEFLSYSSSEGSDSFAIKGVLLVKLDLGLEEENAGGKPNSPGCRLTGYLTHTHLQARLSARSAWVQRLQMNWVESRSRAFKEERAEAGEKVCFDLLTGDLNFDATSGDEGHLAQHPLFDRFKDPCRDENGIERDWTVGTELVQSMLYHAKISTPTGLKSILSSPPDVREEFVVSTNVSVVGGDRNGKRRIDYICLDETIDVGVTVDSFCFVTALATLTDHVPTSMTFTVM